MDQNLVSNDKVGAVEFQEAVYDSLSDLDRMQFKVFLIECEVASHAIQLVGWDFNSVVNTLKKIRFILKQSHIGYRQKEAQIH